jgi:hypothetical protein
MKKTKLKPGLNPVLQEVVARIRIARYAELNYRDQEGLAMTDADYAELEALKPWYLANKENTKVTVKDYLDSWGERPPLEMVDLSPAAERCLPKPVSTDWENYDENSDT